MLKYTYALFLRHPETGEVQHGTISIDSDTSVSWDNLIESLHTSEVIRKDLAKGYTLLGLNIVTVAIVPNQETIEAMNASPEPASHNSAEELFKDLES